MTLDLDRLKAALADPETSPRPWQVEWDHWVTTAESATLADFWRAANARLAVEAVNALPGLLKVVEAAMQIDTLCPYSFTSGDPDLEENHSGPPCGECPWCKLREALGDHAFKEPTWLGEEVAEAALDPERTEVGS